MSQFIRVTARPADEFVTRTGEQMEVTLDDGSHVWLGAKSRLSVAFTGQQRAVRLDSGEAFFSVRKDRRRPFTVHASNGDITAVGTAFNVREVADRVIVTVAEGVVKVSREGQTGHDGARSQSMLPPGSNSSSTPTLVSTDSPYSESESG